MVSLRRRLTSSMVTAVVDCESDSDRLAFFSRSDSLPTAGLSSALCTEVAEALAPDRSDQSVETTGNSNVAWIKGMYVLSWM